MCEDTFKWRLTMRPFGAPRSTRWFQFYCVSLVVSVMLTPFPLLAQAQGKDRTVEHLTSFRTIQIDGLSIFYREAGPKDAPTILLLHGLPSSSRMFEPLFARLADRYHLVAPDYPGFGHSDWPDPKKFAYTFDHIAEVMNHFAEATGAFAVHAVYAGLRRTGGFSDGVDASGASGGADRAGCRGAQ